MFLVFFVYLLAQANTDSRIQLPPHVHSFSRCWRRCQEHFSFQRGKHCLLCQTSGLSQDGQSKRQASPETLGPSGRIKQIFQLEDAIAEETFSVVARHREGSDQCVVRASDMIARTAVVWKGETPMHALPLNSVCRHRTLG